MIMIIFFFQAEDGIRDRNVTGVQTCALPISACDVSGAGCVVSGRACVVSCATSSGAGPASSPATRASRAARSERQIVVLLIKGLRERVERFRLAPRLGRHLGGGFGTRAIARAPPPPPPPPPAAPPRPNGP